MGLASVALFGFLGLAMDMGRMYITKNEAQAYADAGALAAAQLLDGTSAGVTAAKNAATGLGNKTSFNTASFTGTTVEVATSTAGPWTSANTPPSPATDYTYVRVTASVSVPFYFAPVVSAFAGSAVTQGTVKAQATGAQLLQTTFATGAFPFSPIAFDGATGGAHTTAPFGFVAGVQYTMRYAANGKSACDGDEDAFDPNHKKIGSARGFWGSNSASTASAEILGLVQEETLTIGQVLPGVGGAKTSVESAIEDHINLDGDITSSTYAAYVANPAHNGQRVVVMPIQSEVDGTVLAFGSFFLLDPNQYGHTGNSNWCAIFIGLSNVSGTGGTGASSTPGAYQVKLVQ